MQLWGMFLGMWQPQLASIILHTTDQVINSHLSGLEVTYKAKKAAALKITWLVQLLEEFSLRKPWSKLTPLLQSSSTSHYKKCCVSWKKETHRDWLSFYYQQTTKFRKASIQSNILLHPNWLMYSPKFCLLSESDSSSPSQAWLKGDI